MVSVGNWLLIFRRLVNIARVCFDYRVSNAKVRCQVFGKDDKSIDGVANVYRMKWFVHVMRMPITPCLDGQW